jgi:hypothetical protein
MYVIKVWLAGSLESENVWILCHSDEVSLLDATSGPLQQKQTLQLQHVIHGQGSIRQMFYTNVLFPRIMHMIRMVIFVWYSTL